MKKSQRTEAKNVLKGKCKGCKVLIDTSSSDTLKCVSHITFVFPFMHANDSGGSSAMSCLNQRSMQSGRH
jgi:hypothetical protein